MHKEIRNTLAYIVVATFVVITAIWQAQVSAARDLEARHRSLPPPPKTKHGIRPASQTFTGDVVADYIARCEKGMTDQEIAWILEDYRNVGLLPFPPYGSAPQVLISYRSAAQRWYQSALVDGLRLSREQSNQSASQLAQLYEKDFTAYTRAIGTSPMWAAEAGDQVWTVAKAAASHFIDLSFWPYDERYRPSNLCSLTPAQRKIVWQQDENIVGALLPEFPSDDIRSSFLYPRQVTMRQAEERGGSLDFIVSTAVLPYLKTQKFDPILEPVNADPGKFLDCVRHLHPAQLKLLLLDQPFAPHLQEAMESESR